MIHQYQLNGYNIVLDANSGAIHLVDEPAYDVIALCADSASPAEILAAMQKKYPDRPEINAEEIGEILDDIETLRTEGKLFSQDPYEELAAGYRNQHTEIKAMCLHVAHTCNLTCDYCFAKQGRYHGEAALMSFEVGKQALDFLVAHSGSRKNLEVDFFGGEPLLAWDVVKELVAYARSLEPVYGKHFRFTLTTNGMLLSDEVTEFANREMDNVVLSLDGRKEIHDALRKTPDGKGSYDIILPKFKRFTKLRGEKEYYIRGTFTHRNTDFTQDILHMADLGFTKLSMEPVVCAEDDPSALTEADLPVLFAQYEILAKEMLRRKAEGVPFTFYHYMLDLERGPCIYKRMTGCGAGTEYLAVTPAGDLYPCHQFANDPSCKMGDVRQGITNPALREEMAGCSVYTRENCKTCWARLYCSGGCAANAYHATGTVLGTYDYGCDLFRKRLECAIMMKAAEGK